jgi:hypothetical protein
VAEERTTWHVFFIAAAVEPAYSPGGRREHRRRGCPAGRLRRKRRRGCWQHVGERVGGCQHGDLRGADHQPGSEHRRNVDIGGHHPSSQYVDYVSGGDLGPDSQYSGDDLNCSDDAGNDHQLGQQCCRRQRRRDVDNEHWRSFLRRQCR